MKYIIALLFSICLGLIILFLNEPQTKVEFQVDNVAFDTTFKNPIWTGSDGYGKHVLLRATGTMDDSTEICVRDPTYLAQFLLMQLPKGKFDTTWTGEYYEKKAEVVYLHKQAKEGRIKILFRLLTSEGDTIP